jgi:prepilin-type N-terminal cleavage/methylation domain-containing protein
MRRQGSRTAIPGFTLVELVVVVFILAVLAALILAGTASARERARQATCISHLHQLGQAVAMYRQDYGGIDLLGSPSEMGLPPSPLQLLQPTRRGRRYLSSDDLLFCPDFRPDDLPPHPLYHYLWKVWNNGQEITPGYPAFAEVVAERGSDYPLMADPWHNPPPEAAGVPTLVIVLRLDGRVSEGHVPPLTELPAWKW